MSNEALVLSRGVGVKGGQGREVKLYNRIESEREF